MEADAQTWFTWYLHFVKTLICAVFDVQVRVSKNAHIHVVCVYVYVGVCLSVCVCVCSV